MTNKERVLLVGVGDNKVKRWQLVQSIEELASLARTAGGEVVESFLQLRDRYNPATLLGTGKVLELSNIARALSIDLIIFDAELSAAQIRNIEAGVNVRVIDRTTLILDIFALHARTREAKLQVELAQLEYRLSRLVGFRTELSRLGGGIGTRGPGEKKLEVDRRRINARISTLRKALGKVEQSKEVQRKRRGGFYKTAVVGYTNAGKSSLVNAMTRAGLYTADHLFSTLDSNTSVLFLAPGRRLLISDTVGFLRDLPHGLIASFHATLAEVLDANLLIHIVDAVAEDLESKISTVEKVLEEIGAVEKPMVMVFNKTDRLFEDEKVRLMERYPRALFVSARTGAGVADLKAYLKEHFFHA
jgi:GTP-binding protein HflX